MKGMVKNYFVFFLNSGDILNKLKSKGLLASSLSTYDFSTVNTTLPYNLINEKLMELIAENVNREGSIYLFFNENRAFFYF